MTAPFDLSGQTILVTGAGRGLGRSAALMLAESGADIVAVFPARFQNLKRSRPRSKPLAGPARLHPLDVTDRAAVRTFIGGLDGAPRRHQQCRVEQSAARA